MLKVFPPDCISDFFSTRTFVFYLYIFPFYIYFPRKILIFTFITCFFFLMAYLRFRFCVLHFIRFIIFFLTFPCLLMFLRLTLFPISSSFSSSNSFFFSFHYAVRSFRLGDFNCTKRSFFLFPSPFSFPAIVFLLSSPWLPRLATCRLQNVNNTKDLSSPVQEMTSPRQDSLRLQLINMFCSQWFTLPHALDLHIPRALSRGGKGGKENCSR